MSRRKEEALEHFANGCNCAQSVLRVYCDEFGLDQQTALRLTAGLGVGFRTGEMCGSIVASALVIGLKYGHDKADCNAKTAAMIKAFRETNGSVLCRDIVSQNKGRRCTAMVSRAVDYLEGLESD